MAKKLKFNWGVINKNIETYEEKDKKKSFEKDERFYEPQKKDDGSFMSIIRFLPMPEGEDLPKIKYYEHFYQDKGGYFIENCPTTISESCPVCEANGEEWNNGNQAVAKRRKRKMHYVANIVVLKDSQCPENEGKVFLYKFGTKINEFIIEARHPRDEDEKDCNIYDPYDGADFKLKIYLKEFIEDGVTKKYPQYDNSRFKNPSELFGGDNDKIAEAYKECYSLDAFIDKSNYKSYDDLALRFEKVSKKKTSTNDGADQSSNKESKNEAADLNMVESDEELFNNLEKNATESDDKSKGKDKSKSKDKNIDANVDNFDFEDDKD